MIARTVGTKDHFTSVLSTLHLFIGRLTILSQHQRLTAIRACSLVPLPIGCKSGCLLRRPSVSRVSRLQDADDHRWVTANPFAMYVWYTVPQFCIQR